MALEPATALRLLEDATRTVPGVLRRELRLADLAGWDSLGLVQFMSTIADSGGRTFQVAELRAPATVGELLDLVTADQNRK